MKSESKISIKSKGNSDRSLTENSSKKSIKSKSKEKSKKNPDQKLSKKSKPKSILKKNKKSMDKLPVPGSGGFDESKRKSCCAIS